MKTQQLSCMIFIAVFALPVLAADDAQGEIPNYPQGTSPHVSLYEVYQNGPIYQFHVESAVGEAAYYPGPSYAIDTNRFMLVAQTPEARGESGEAPSYPSGIGVVPVGSGMAMKMR